MAHHRTATRRRYVVLGALVLVALWLAASAIGGPLVGRLSEVQKNDNASFLPDKSESTEVSKALTEFTDQQQIPFLVVVEAKEGPLTREHQAALAKFVAEVPNLALPALGNGAKVGDYLLPASQIAAIPSEDGKAALIAIPMDAPKAEASVGDTTALFESAQALRDAAGATVDPAGLVSHVGGPGGLISDLVTAFAGIDGVLLLVALVVVLVILLVVYRSPILPLLVLFSAVSGLALAVLAVFPLAEGGHLQLSGQSQGIMFILVVGAATDYALLLVSRFREELHDHSDSWVALKAAWRGALEPILASGATVILALLCLLLASLGSTSGLGPVGALGIVGAMLAALTLLPALLALFGRKAFWPFVPSVDHQHAADKVGTRSLWGRIASLVGTHPRRVWVLTLAALAIAAAFLPTLKVSGVSTADTFLTNVDSVDATKAIEKHFPGGAGSPVQIVAPQASAEAVVQALTKESGVSDPYVGLTPPRTGAPTPAPVVRDGQVVIQATLDASADSPAAADIVQRLRGDLDSLSPSILVGGEAATNLDVREASAADLRLLIPVILGLIFLVLCVLLRSVLAPLLLVLANVLSFAATLGISALVFNHLLDLPGGDPSLPLYGFVFLVALGIDYSIFLMTRVREESLRVGTRRGTLIALAVTGGVITSAGIVLASTFSALAVLPLIFLLQTAFIVAFGVLLDTLVVRSLLVPALVHDIGNAVWWPSRLARASRDPKTSPPAS